MKTLGSIFVALLLAVITQATAQDMRKELGDVQYKTAVKNGLMALKSPNDGLRRSAIYLLGTLQADDAVIPLMSVLHNSTDEKSRIATAWALSKIGNSVGTFAVKQAARFDDSKKVRLHAAWYYNLLVSEGTFVFIPAVGGSNTVAEGR
jgi:HEAT repeat protein